MTADGDGRVDQLIGPAGAGFDHDKVERGVRLILEGIGEDLDRDGLIDTPARVARMYSEITSGLREDPTKVLEAVFEADHDEMIMVRDVPMASICEHHLLPFVGKAHVAYIPNDQGRITGLSKLARLVDGLARRPQVQERLTAQIADAMVRAAGATGGAGRDRGRAPVHEHARGPQAGRRDRDLGRPGDVPRLDVHPHGGDEPPRGHPPGLTPPRLTPPRLTPPRGRARSPSPAVGAPYGRVTGDRGGALPAVHRPRKMTGPTPGGRLVSVAPLAPHDLRVGDLVLPTSRRCLVMGVVNVTPDSFSDGGRYLDPAAAVAHGTAMVAEGADLLDVGGESTRPGATEVPEAVELERVLPVVEELAATAGVPVSVDTRKAAVAAAALAAGAAMVNDVSAGRHDPDLLGVVADAKVPLVLMHMLGTPATMQDDPRYDDVVAEVEAFLTERCLAAEFAGVDHQALVVDPGIGFGKRDRDNYALLDGLARLTRLGHPVLVGTSRKAFIGRVLDSPADQRVEGTAATVVWAVERGARMVRVHDVAPLVRAVRMTEALLEWGAT